MSTFMDQNFLLDTPAAVELYHNHAAECPIIDYHNHLSAADIAQSRRFRNLTEIWLEADHYKWRAMRSCGVDEAYITGDKPDYEKFLAWAEVLPKLAGCPLYHWTHLELQRYFGITELLNPTSAPRIWQQTCEMLGNPGFDTVSLLEKQNVRVLCTTDDPADGLEWHRVIAEEREYSFRVLPSFRPDRFLTVESDVFPVAVAELAERNGESIETLEDLERGLSLALDRFQAAGCKVSDHGFSHFSYGRGDAHSAFRKAMSGETPSGSETADFKGELLRFLGREYHRRGIAMQLHLGPLRNANPRLLASFGADAGGDSVGLTTDPFDISALLSDLSASETLPRTVLYNLNPADNMVFSTMAVNFAPTVRYGAAWWFNDTLRGMNLQLDELMETGQLAASIGMLTDSRSFTSFPRHEYFRRILCAKLGQLVESGLYPNDIPTLGKLVEDLCWRNAVDFFGFQIK